MAGGRFWRSLTTAATLAVVTVAAPAVGSAPDDPLMAAANGGIATEQQIVTVDGDLRLAPWGIDSRGGSFSPDGRSLAWVRHVINKGPDAVAVWVTDATGSREVFRMDKALQLASWAPDGRRLVIAAFDFGINSSASYAWIVPVDGSGPPVEIMRGKFGALTDVAWSPDGTRIAFTRAMRDIFYYDVATGATSQLTHGCTWDSLDLSKGGEPDCATYYGFEGAITWSPEGTRLAAISRKSVVTIDAFSGVVTTLVSGRKWLKNALWSPDGNWIAYGVNDENSFRVPAAGGTPSLLASTVVSSWQPCPTGTCATLGEPRPKARIVVKPRLGARTLTVAGIVKPASERESWREEIRVQLSAKTGGGGWRTVKTFPDLKMDESAFSKTVARPNADQCRIKVVYAGGWTRTGAKTTKTFAC